MMGYRNRIIAFAGILLFVTAGCSTGKPQLTEKSYIYVKKEMPADLAMIRTIQPYTQQIERILNEAVGYAPQPLSKGKPNAPLGNYISDLLLAFARNRSDIPRADMAIFNNGGLRTSIPADSVRIRDIFELMPFENALVLVKMPGDSILKMAPYLLERGGEPVAGLIFHSDKGQTERFMVDGKNVEAGQSYYVLTSDYLAAGGDRMYFFGGLPQVSLNIKMRDAIIDAMRSEFRNGQYVRAEADDRLLIKRTKE